MAKSAQNYATSNSEMGRLEFAIRQYMKHVHTSITVKVLEVFPILPGQQRGGKIGLLHAEPQVTQLDNYGRAIKMSTLYNIPYVRYQGGKCAIVVDPKPGDTGLVGFCERDISKFKRSSKKQNPPDSYRMHDQADGVYIGGVLNEEPEIYIQLDDDRGIIIKTGDKKNIAVDCGGGATVNITGEYSLNAEKISFNGGGAGVARHSDVTACGAELISGAQRTEVNGRMVVRKGDSGSHGGEVTTGSASTLAEGSEVARIGDTYACPIHGDNPIVTGSDDTEVGE